MNITEAKALFFAQYLWQKVFLWDLRGPLGLSDKQLWERTDSDRSCLLLRTVEQLTDEETETFLKNAGWDWNPKYLAIEKFIISVTSHKIVIVILDDVSNNDGSEVNNLGLQYLLRIGILLPFTYLNEENKPVTLSPDEIIKLGWVKIKE